MDDDYPTSARTYATLRIYDKDLDPDLVTRTLGIEPICVQIKGQTTTGRYGVVRIATIGGWFLSTEGQVDSRDVRRHLFWLLDKLLDTDTAIQALRAGGHRMDVFCFWRSAEGHGGPTLSPEIMSASESSGSRSYSTCTANRGAPWMIHELPLLEVVPRDRWMDGRKPP